MSEAYTNIHGPKKKSKRFTSNLYHKWLLEQELQGRKDESYGHDKDIRRGQGMWLWKYESIFLEYLEEEILQEPI